MLVLYLTNKNASNRNKIPNFISKKVTKLLLDLEKSQLSFLKNIQGKFNYF